jgi:hypothetical protein
MSWSPPRLFPLRCSTVSWTADMANVWFVQRVGGVWKKLGEQPAFQRPLGDLVFKLDLGPQRRLGARDFPEPADGVGAIDARSKAFTEISEADLEGSVYAGLVPGWYDSPYGAMEVTRRLG